MSVPLRVLLVEDRLDDAELVLRELRRSGYDPRFERVETAGTLRGVLARERWDVVLSDWHMPQFDAPSALRIVREIASEMPFIIVSGTVGEDVAVAAIRAGANDFMTKGSLARLVPAIEREMKEAALRKSHRTLQEQLYISERMASMGILAAGVAHEINNPLSAVLGNLELALEDLRQTAEAITGASVAPTSIGPEQEGVAQGGVARAVESLRDAREASLRIRNIVRDLRIFSRSGEEERATLVDVQRVIDSRARMAWNELRHRARLVKDYGDVPAVRGNESRLAQVFLNLLVNAAQAIPEGSADKNEIRVRTVTEADRVAVEVRDTGTGIPPENLKRIFDPFFTTKPVGIGTGLGLAICHRIVTGVHGTIEVESELDRGTVVRVFLPIAREQEQEQETREPPQVVGSSLGPPRRGRILVVDDEPMICTAIQRMLAPDHDVVTVVDGREALRLVAEGERFDVILCDLMMPNLTGVDLHVELSKSNPEMAARMAFMTGGAFTTSARAFLDGVPNPRLDKPFDRKGLALVVERLLR